MFSFLSKRNLKLQSESPPSGLTKSWTRQGASSFFCQKSDDQDTLPNTTIVYNCLDFAGSFKFAIFRIHSWATSINTPRKIIQTPIWISINISLRTATQIIFIDISIYTYPYINNPHCNFPYNIMGVGPPVHRVFNLWFCKEPTLQNHILTPKDEGYNIIMEDRWTYGKMDGLDFVRVPDPLGGVPKWSHFHKIWRDFWANFTQFWGWFCKYPYVSNLFPW